MKKNWQLYLLLANLFMLVGCSEINGALLPAEPTLQDRIKAFSTGPQKHRIVLATEDEPGRKLTILAQLKRKENGASIANAGIFLYQANSEGEYEEAVPGDETTARIKGTVTSDA